MIARLLRLSWLAVTVCALVVALLPARAEQLVTALSNDVVSITSNFTGSRLVVFGTIERDAQTVARTGSYEVVVQLAGPRTTLITRRKERTAGIWINADSERLVGVPSFLAVLSTSPLDEITSEQTRARLVIGLDMVPFNKPPEPEPPVHTDFEQAFLRLMQADLLYQQAEDGVEFLSSQLFRAPVALPATVPVGTYVATAYLFQDGTLLSSTTEELVIAKIGFEQFMTTFAHQHGLIYGLTAVLIACLTGWVAGVIFRRD